MDKVKYIRIQESDGSLTAKIPFATNSENVTMADGSALEDTIAGIKAGISGPSMAATVEEMTDTERIYVYTGSETGYINGNWYYYNGSAWVSGGVYNSASVDTDTSLTQAGMAADAKAAGEVVMIQDSQPTTAANRIWLDTNEQGGIQVPTYQEFTELKDETESGLNDLKSDLTLTNNYVYEEVETTLPQGVKGTYKLEFSNEGDEIICGTQNVAQLLEIKEGIATIDGVTFTVIGNTVIISGTATDSIYFSLADCAKKLPSELAQMTLPLPEQLYTLSVKATAGTSPYPSILVRSKISGSVVSAQNNTAQFTMDKTTCGGIYLYCQSGRTYNITYVIGLFPYATTNINPYREETSKVTVYTENGVYNLDGYAWKVGTATIKKLQSNFPKMPKLVYSTRTIPYSSMVECLDIYIPAKEGYVNYIFGRTESALTPAEGGGNVWRLVRIDAVTDELFYRFRITSLGETEMAIKIAGRDDFIGGTTHGDEVMDADSLLFVLDGQPVDITTFTDVTEFETLQAFLTSNMYDPADHTTLVGVHGREWLFNSDGLYIGQTVEYKENLTLANSYMPMVCALRGNDTESELQITDTYVDDGNYMLYDVSEGGFTTYPNKLKQDVREINLFGHDSGVRITVKILEQPESLNGEGVHLYNGVNTYNKIYCCICGYGGSAAQQTVANGDKWQVKSQIIVEVG